MKKYKIRIFIILGLSFFFIISWYIFDQMTTPKMYRLNNRELKILRKESVVSEDIIDKLDQVRGLLFQSKSELLDFFKREIGDIAYDQHHQSLNHLIKDVPCWPNPTSQKVYEIKRSEGHALYNSLTSEPLIKSKRLPEVPTQFLFFPNNEILVLGKFGDIVHLSSQSQVVSKFKLNGVFQGTEDQGSLGMTLDPDFEKNQFIYVSYVNEKGDQNVIQRLKWNNDPDSVLKSRVDILRVSKYQDQKLHGIGAIHFNQDGILIVPIGDPTNHAQRNWDSQGKLFGIIPSHSDSGGYENPPMSFAKILISYLKLSYPAALAKGLRSPWTITIWRQFVFIGDVGGAGPNTYEEINLYSSLGQNFGWDICRSPHFHGKFTPPVITYHRTDPAPAEGTLKNIRVWPQSVWVGVVYDNPQVNRYDNKLDQRLLYGDFYQGFIRGTHVTSSGELKDDVFLTYLPYVTNMRIGNDGYIYVLTAVGKYGFHRLKLVSELKQNTVK